MINRNTPLPITPHNELETRVNGLRDYSPPPSTYTLKKLLPDGTIVFVGEFPTPEVRYGFTRGKK